MALRFPARTRSSTSTTGLGTYTLSEPTSAGWRNFTRAVVDGDLVDGDQVGYAVVDTTVDGGPKLIEVGRGTYDDTAKTLTRDVIYQPNGSAIDWGAGTRDVIVLDLPQLAVWLIDDQTIAGKKTFSDLLTAILSGTALAVDGTTALLAQRSGSTSDACRVSIVGGNAGFSELTFGDTDGQYRGRLVYGHTNERLDLYTAGGVRATIDSAAAKFTPPVQDSAGVPYDKFPSGTAMVFRQAAAPTGWTKSTADNDAALRVVSGTPGASGGTRGVSSATVGAHTLSTSQIPSHVHGISAGVKSLDAGGGADSIISNPFGTGTVFNSDPAGGGASHDHTLALKYVDCLVATKN